MKRSVTVHGKPYEVFVHQKSKSVWEAVGDYTEGLAVPGSTRREILVTGRTESSALKRWIDAARYFGN